MARCLAVLITVLIFIASVVPNELLAVENVSWGRIKADQQIADYEPAGKLIVSGNKAGGLKNRQNKVFDSMPIVEVIPNRFYDYSNTNGTRTILTFKVSVPMSAKNEYVELNSFVFRVFGEGVYPFSLQLWAYHDVDMTMIANYSFNPYIPSEGYDILGGFITTAAPFPDDVSLRVYPGESLYFSLYADLLRFFAADSLEVSIREMKFNIVRLGQ